VAIASGAIMRRDAPGRDGRNGIQSDATTLSGRIMSVPEATDEAAEAAQQTSPLAAPSVVNVAPRPQRNGLLNWLLVRRELSQAREDAARFSDEQREYVRRAKLAFELGELALAPGNAVRSGSTAPLAANLFRQSLYWALLSQKPDAGRPSPESVWASADSATLAQVSRNETELAQVATVIGANFVELANGTPEAQRATADQLRRAANRLVTSSQRVLWRLEWVKMKRVLRIALAVVVCLAPFALAIAFWPAKPDLAKGKPWHTSSIGIECHPEKSDCGGVTTDILFHTKLESNPWFEYDFGAPLAFSSLTIRNRQDFGLERAVPLVVEVSNDDKQFQEIARRIDPFSTWKPSFPTQHARYLRLRTARESMLHLEAIKVHP
jgi:hypothetical protein